MKIPTCDCVSKTIPPDRYIRYQQAIFQTVGTGNNKHDRDIIFREIVLTLNFCPACGAPYKESEG